MLYFTSKFWFKIIKNPLFYFQNFKLTFVILYKNQFFLKILNFKPVILISILLMLILFPSTAKAQFDTTYVHLTEHKFNVAPIFEYYKSKMNVIKFAPDLDHLNETSGRSFSGKSNLYLGIGISFKRLGFSISFKLPYTDIPELKESSSMSFIGGYSYRKFYAELNFISYNGFLEKTYSLDDASAIEETKISLHNKYSQIGGELYYFSAKKYRSTYPSTTLIISGWF